MTGAAVPSRLPLLDGPRRNVVAGTYLAEQRAEDSFDLLATGTPREPVTQMPKPSPRRRHAGAPGARLENQPGRVLQLPAMTQLPALGAGARQDEDEDVGALIYQRNKEARELVELSLSDTKFRNWLTLPSPPPKRDGVRPSPRSGQAVTTPRGSPAALRAPPPQRPAPLGRIESVGGGEEAAGAEEAADGGKRWHVFLLQSTFEACTPKHVLNSLSRCLGLSLEEAMRKVAAGQERRLVELACCEDGGEAFEHTHTLRQEGLVVQVVSQAGVPGEGGSGSGSPSRSPRAAKASNYAEVFEKSRRGNVELTPQRCANQALAPGSRCRPARRGRKLVKLHAFPADYARGSVLQAMTTTGIKRLGRRRRTSFQLGDTSFNFKTLIAKHRPGLPEKLAAGPANAGPGKAEDSDGSEEDKPKQSPGAHEKPWGVVIDAVMTKVDPLRREACEMLRFFIFGSIGNEAAKTSKEKEKIYFETAGSRDKVIALFHLWERIDQDHSGRVDITEFREFAGKHMKERAEELLAVQKKGGEGLKEQLPSWAQLGDLEEVNSFVQKLCVKLEQALLTKKSLFSVEDLMRVIWPCAQVTDLRHMRMMYTEFRRDSRVVTTPPLLPEADFDGLCSVFRYIDTDGSGEVMLEELLQTGLVLEEQARSWMLDGDHNGDGSLDMFEFCEMMCPNGYRAHPKARLASREDGIRLVFDDGTGCWRRAGPTEAA